MAAGDSVSYAINDLLLITKTISVDLRDMMEELNIYDNIFLPTMSGNIVLRDALGLSKKLKFDGTEYLKIDIGKDAENMKIEKTFRVYKQSNKQEENSTSEVYILHFCAEEFIYSEQQKVNQAYEDTYSNIARSILIDYLDSPQDKFIEGFHDASFGIKYVNIPNLKPFAAVDWCMKRALDIYDAPAMLFFENRDGYNMCSIYSLIKNQEPMAKLTFGIKNFGDDIAGDLFGVRQSKVISNFDAAESAKSGMLSSKFKGFDPVTRTYYNKEINFAEIYEDRPHLNRFPFLSMNKNRDGKLPTETFDAKQSLSPMQSNQSLSKYAQANDPYAQPDDMENYDLQRKAIFANLLNRRLQLVMPGNPMLTSGRQVELEYPRRSVRSENDEDIVDDRMSGNYLIIGVRHKFGFKMYETIMEVATDSSNEPSLYNDSENQSKAINE